MISYLILEINHLFVSVGGDLIIIMVNSTFSGRFPYLGWSASERASFPWTRENSRLIHVPKSGSQGRRRTKITLPACVIWRRQNSAAAFYLPAEIRRTNGAAALSPENLHKTAVIRTRGAGTTTRPPLGGIKGR